MTLRTIERRNYPEDRIYPVVTLLGLGAVMLSLAVGAVIGLYQGDFFAQSASARAADSVRQGVVAATGAWNPFVLFFGIALLMTAVVVVLRRIVKTIRVELAGSMVTHLPQLLTPGRRG